MNTIILFWNPWISSFSMRRFHNTLGGDIEELATFNWSVWEHEKAHKGDRFFMLRCGQGNNGIVASGTFISEPYQAEDWSGRRRTTFYMDMKMEYMIDLDSAPHISSDELMEKLPGFDWTGGHSGRLLQPELSEKLISLWEEYIRSNTGIFDSERAAYFVD